MENCIRCKYCGEIVDTAELYCPSCGKKLYSATSASREAHSGPKVPAGNYFAAHEQIISKIARRAAQLSADRMRNAQEWEPLHNGYSDKYWVNIIVRKDDVEFDTHYLEPINSILFKNYVMADIPEANTDAFIHALKPFLDVYFPEEIEKAFANVSSLIKRTTSVTYDKYLDSIDFDGRSVKIESIRLSLYYTYPPAPKLNSW